MNTRAPGPLLYATIFVLTAIEFLQLSMVAFGAGPIMGEVSITPEDFSLIAAVYASVAILVISMQRWFVTRLGGRLFIQCAAVVSLLGAVLCATSHDFASFLLGRVVMALGGGAFFTSARMIIHHALAGPRRFTGIKSLAYGVALCIAAGPWLAAQAVSNDTWSAIFWLLAILDGLAFVLASSSLTSDLRGYEEGRSDWNPWLQVLLVGGSFALLYALQRFYYDFYGDVLYVAATLVAALVALLAYAHHQRKNERPLLHLRPMLHLRYLAGVTLFLFAYLMLGANNYVVPSMLLRSLGYSWETVGHFEALGALAAVATFTVVARLLPKHPAPRKYWITGFLALATFGVLLARLDPAASPWLHILPALACYNIFLLTVLPITAMQAFRQMEGDETLFSNAQQVKNMLAQAGIALGISVATLGQQWRATVHYNVLNAQVTPDNPVYLATIRHLQGALTPSVGPSEAARIAVAEVARMLARQSALLANIDHFRLIAVLGVLGVAVTLLQRVFR
ncbi:MFS transporter [Rhodanobacter ginsengisoli]|uniref:MFS transporter n=1 Tax=Rhodanobacter ginsengisoli TaxID=418646 RepID=A0ABW0QM62_9GAMM